MNPQILSFRKRCVSPNSLAPATNRFQTICLVSAVAILLAGSAGLVYVGFRTLFVGGHVPGATFHGSASTEQGLSDLKKWAEELPRTTNLVIYCGCCPLEKCPNIRPAFTALDKMGFKKLWVLVLPTNFATDWADK